MSEMRVNTFNQLCPLRDCLLGEIVVIPASRETPRTRVVTVARDGAYVVCRDVDTPALSFTIHEKTDVYREEPASTASRILANYELPEMRTRLLASMESRIADAVADAHGEWSECGRCHQRVPSSMIAVELKDGAPISEKDFMWCIACHSQRVVEIYAERASHAEAMSMRTVSRTSGCSPRRVDNAFVCHGVKMSFAPEAPGLTYRCHVSGALYRVDSDNDGDSFSYVSCDNKITAQDFEAVSGALLKKILDAHR